MTTRESPFLVTEVADRLRCSLRTVHELTRLRLIPHRRLPGFRRCLFREDELDSWENGADLEVTELSHGGRIVRPRSRDPYSTASPGVKPLANGPRAPQPGD
jgi:excisionase family DNA binding protein